ncbi:hypothetical protein DSO57_1021131 [Entomophthora muscae]|uniref:Uncharacterized protein n=1 Tax=Entomophthora muscae TaxID=34485 RepID=A0ACC2RI98_9FUNG|nr:hypothetical protein DSO57_1021131 [Entomophthora muscae]
MKAASEVHLPEHQLRTGCTVRLSPWTSESAIFKKELVLKGIVVGISEAFLDVALDNAVGALKRRDATWLITNVSNSAIFDR